jgi:hypothetical protein
MLAGTDVIYNVMLDMPIFDNLTSCHMLVTQQMVAANYAEWTVSKQWACVEIYSHAM